MPKNITNERPLALIFGGTGSERRVSELGAAALIEEAQSVGFDFLPIGITADGDWFLYSGDVGKIRDGSWSESREFLAEAYPVRLRGESGFITAAGIVRVLGAFPLMHGVGGEDGVIQGALSAAGIAFLGCDTWSGAVSFDKACAKLIAESIGIRCVPWILYIDGYGASDGAVAADLPSALCMVEQKLGFPVFVKPSRQGSSIGASLATCASELEASIEKALREDSRVIIEQALLDKAELECAYFASSVGDVFARPYQITVAGGFYDFDIKYSGCGGARLEPAFLSDGMSVVVREYSERLRRALGIRDISRFDYFLLPSGELYFNEVNTMPGFTEASLYLRMLKDAGVGTEAFLSRLRALVEDRIS